MQSRHRAIGSGTVLLAVFASWPDEAAAQNAPPSAPASSAPASPNPALPAPAPGATTPPVVPAPTSAPAATPDSAPPAEPPPNAAASTGPSAGVLVEGDEAAPPPRSHEHERPRRKRTKGVREHDGFYARFAIGFSGFGDTVVSEATYGDNYRDQSLVTGFSTVSELAAGGTVGRGLVLGGGIYTATVETPFVYDGSGRALPAEFRRPDTFSLIGMMGDLYPNPRKGLHLQAAVGLTVLTGLNPGSDYWRDRHAALGGGGMLGIGYEWWVGEQWSVGILGRATVGALAEDDSLGYRWYHFVAAWPSVLFTVTYH